MILKDKIKITATHPTIRIKIFGWVLIIGKIFKEEH